MLPERTTIGGHDGRSLRRVLCVDDEPNVVAGLALHLRRDYEVHTATSPAQAVAKVRTEGPFAVMISDMRMPQVDGATLLARIRVVSPDTVRMVLTGFADLDSAIAAVNEAAVFRFLTKPCDPALLRQAVADACTQYRMVTDQRVLLEQTLRGTIKALSDVLALAAPTTFGRVSRIQKHVRDLAGRLEIPGAWDLEVATMLRHLGDIAIPEELAAKIHRGDPLDGDEAKVVARSPFLSRRLVHHIPRLDAVLAILDGLDAPDGSEAASALPVRILRLCRDWDELEARGETPEIAMATLRERVECYGLEVFEAFASMRADALSRLAIAEVPLSELAEGMLLAEDVFLPTGRMLIARGYEVSEGLLERLRNFRPGQVKPMLRVVVAQGAGNPR